MSDVGVLAPLMLIIDQGSSDAAPMPGGSTIFSGFPHQTTAEREEAFVTISIRYYPTMELGRNHLGTSVRCTPNLATSRSPYCIQYGGVATADVVTKQIRD